MRRWVVSRVLESVPSDVHKTFWSPFSGLRFSSPLIILTVRPVKRRKEVGGTVGGGRYKCFRRFRWMFFYGSKGDPTELRSLTKSHLLKNLRGKINKRLSKGQLIQTSTKDFVLTVIRLWFF